MTVLLELEGVSRVYGEGVPVYALREVSLQVLAGDFLSILALPFFAPVPGEYAAHYAVGDNYDGHVVGSGPYRVERLEPEAILALAWFQPDAPPAPLTRSATEGLARLFAPR